MDDNDQNAGGSPQTNMPGYHTSGQDTILKSTSEAVPSPSETTEQRLSDPKPVIQSIGETPGDANPALAETIALEQGRASTADLLRARETAEEDLTLAKGVLPYQTESRGARPEEFETTDSGRPNWPDDQREQPVEYMQSPRANMPLGTGATDVYGTSLKGRVDSEVDNAATQAAANTTRSGLAPVGHDVAEDIYTQEEFGRPEPPSDLDMIAPGMVNLPPSEDDDNG